jgi:hypothetical protein
MGSTEAVTSINDARGMWGTVQATQARNTGNWPALLVTETPGPGSGAGFANGFMTVSNVSVTDSNYTVLNDTPNISTAGGYIKVTGRGFVSGCVVYVGGVAATSTTFISSTEVRAQIAAATSNTLMVYVVNPDGSTGIKLSSLVFSGTPTWNTGATLGNQVADTAFSVFFSATSDSAVTYALSSGSTLPAGTSLFANGLFTGTVTGISSDTTYSFSVDAVDAENQDTARTFSVTFSTGDQYFSLTPVLLNGEANVWIRDSSVNNFLPTIGGDTRPTAFSPYNSNWSGFFDGSSHIQAAADSSFDITGDFTLECWFYITAQSALNASSVRVASMAGYSNGSTANAGWEWFVDFTNNRYYIQSWGNGAANAYCAFTPALNTWYHLAATKSGATTYLFINGASQTLLSNTLTINAGSSPVLNIGRGSLNSNYFGYCIGYISNFRIIKGTAQYTANFTPATSSLPVVSTNTSILTLQNNRFIDANATPKTLTIGSGTPRIASFAPFTETDTTTGSAYFDGTGDYLDYTGSSNLAFGTNDFTIELFIYINVLGTFMMFYDSRPAGTNGAYPTIYKHSDNTIRYYANTGERITGPALGIGQWYNIVVSRASGSTRMFVDGVQVGSTYADSTTYLNGASRPRIGASGVDGASSVNGFISDVRVLNGTGLYTANFTPATSSLSSVANTQLLTLQYRTGENNHRFIDEGGNKYIATRGGNASQGSFSPFSPAGWSAYFDGTGDYLTVPASSDFNFGTDDYTIEGWIYSSSLTWTLYATGGGGSSDQFSCDAGTLYWNYTALGAGVPNFFVTSDLNTWTHVAASRTSGNTRIFKNGGLKGSTSTVASIGSSVNTLQIGRRSDGFYLTTGYMSNIRVVKGTSQYTANFTPATTALTAVANTKLLILQNNRFIDANTTPKTITTSGDVKIQAFSPFRPSAAYTPSLHGGSAYFDGTGDHLKALSTSNTLLPANNTNTFTVDGWVYPTVGGVLAYLVGEHDPVGPSNNVSVDISAGNKISFRWWTGSENRATSTDSIVPNQWNYFAVVVNNNAITIYVNSTTAGQTGTTTLTTRSLATIGWGVGQYNSSNSFTGYMSGIRWSTGIARTISSIPTAPPAPDNYTTLLFNFTQGGIYDATGRMNFETVADAKISNVASKFGTGSLYFDGTGDYLYATTSTNLIYPGRLGDLTVEAWVYTTSTADQTLFYLNGDTNSVASVRIGLITSGVYLLVSVNGSSWNINTGTVGSVPINTWKHVAVVRNGGTFTVYVDGISVTSSTAVSATSGLYAGTLNLIGAMNQGGATLLFAGYMDDLRITRYARYTSNFTPPTQTFLTK